MRTAPLLLLVAALSTAACNRSEPAPATAPSPTAERLKEDLRQTGQDIRAAADQAATQMRPAFERVKEESREALHNTAERIADRTATQPATSPP
jgi:hypothetical protein